MNFERLRTDIIFFNEMPVRLRHLIGVEERVAVTVRGPFANT